MQFAIDLAGNQERLAAAFCRRKNSRRLAASRLKFRQCLEIAFENRIALRAILQAFQVRFQFRRAFPRQRINHPILLPLGHDHFSLPQIGQVLGDFHLRLAEDFLKMANAERSLREQM